MQQKIFFVVVSSYLVNHLLTPHIYPATLLGVPTPSLGTAVLDSSEKHF